MPPGDQASLRDCLRRRSFLDEFARRGRDERRPGVVPAEHSRVSPRLRRARARAAMHHDQLSPGSSRAVQRARRAAPRTGDRERPPLPVLLAALETLRDLRLAAPRDDIASRHRDLARLREAVGADGD